MLNFTNLPVAVQLWSIRDECNNDFAASMKAVAEMGYDGVETAGFCGLAPAEVAKILADNGLKAEGAHTGVDSILPAALRKTMDDYAAIGCKRLIVPWIGGPWTETEDDWKRFFAVMNLAAEDLAKEGFELGFHNHEDEFRYGSAGLVPIVAMQEGFSSKVKFQFDMSFVYAMGADGLALLRHNAGRVCSIHVKAFSKSNPVAYVGEDDVPWADVIAASVTAGADWLVVEHEDYADTPMNCIRRDLENLRR